MSGPVRILSDLHLGHRISRIRRVESLRPLIAGASTVMFNGDTWEELAPPFRQAGADMLEELRELCAQEGVKAVFLPGNHDPGWSHCGWEELAAGAIVVTHGDATGFDGSPWRRELLTGRARVEALWKERPAAAHDARERMLLAREIAQALPSQRHTEGRHWLQRAWDAAMPPQRALHMLEAWLNIGSAGSAFCSRYFPRAGVLVNGHFHFHGEWNRAGRLVINTGSFMSPGQAHWVEWHDGWLRRGRVDESGASFQKGEVLGVWRVGGATADGDCE